MTDQEKRIKEFKKAKNKAWLSNTRSKLMKSSTSYEWRVYKALPLWLKKNARRQRVFNHEGRTYFFDIYLPCAKVAIEVDGGYHREQRQKDAMRDALARSYGIKTFRITNEAVCDENRLRVFIKTVETYCWTAKTERENDERTSY